MTAAEFVRIRDAAGLSQAQLATTLRIAVTTVANYENGRRRIPGPVSLLMELLDEGRL